MCVQYAYLWTIDGQSWCDDLRFSLIAGRFRIPQSTFARCAFAMHCDLTLLPASRSRSHAYFVTPSFSTQRHWMQGVEFAIFVVIGGCFGFSVLLLATTI